MEAESLLAKPRYYAIQDGNTYYVALAVVEYDMGKAKSPEQKKGVQDVIDMFNKGVAGNLTAVDVTTDFASLGCMITWIGPRGEAQSY